MNKKTNQTDGQEPKKTSSKKKYIVRAVNGNKTNVLNFTASQLPNPPPAIKLTVEHDEVSPWV